MDGLDLSVKVFIKDRIAINNKILCILLSIGKMLESCAANERKKTTFTQVLSAHCIFVAAPEAEKDLEPAQRASIVAGYRNAGSRGHRGYLALLSGPSPSLLMN